MSDSWWTAATYFLLSLTSAVLPWVNAEVLMLTAVPLANTPGTLGALVGVVTLGQMTGKAAIYWIARSGRLPRGTRAEAALLRWRERFERCPRSALGVMLVSAVVGIPPFYLVSIVAGTFHVAFGRFLTVGVVGRSIHFGAIAFVPHLAWRGL